MFRSLVGAKVIVELKNHLVMKGTLQSSDDYLNLLLVEVEVLNAGSFPQLNRISEAFVRGSAVNVVHLPPEDVDLAQVRALSRAEAGG
jgi:small nuclear ribonucleoprotein (snRNP)-like protein